MNLYNKKTSINKIKICNYNYMNSLRKILAPVIKESEKILNKGLGNPYINTSIKVFIGLYAALAAPQLPPAIILLLDNTVVRVLWAFLIVFLALGDPGIALMSAIAFIVTLQLANKYKLIDSSLAVSESGRNTSWLPSAKTAITTSAKEEKKAEPLVSGVEEENFAIF